MKIYHLLIAIVLLVTIPTWSQSWAEKGHKQFQELAYSDAIVSLEKAVQSGNTHSRTYADLADAYYFNANYQAAAKWYQVLFKKPQNQQFIHYFRYAQVLKSIGKGEKAEVVWTEMKTLFPKQSIASESTGDRSWQTLRFKNSGRFTVKVASFNSKESDFGPSYFGKQIIFASTRDTGSVFKRSHSWTNQSFTDLYVVDSNAAATQPIWFSKAVNSKFNESTAVLTKDGLTMYFTRNNSENKKQGSNQNQTTVLKIYKATQNNDEWSIIAALPFCDDSYNVAHPALSPDEKTLFFASDMPGGFGASDLYKVSINVDGTFGTPENLGAKINAAGRETFPFVSLNNDLYFASERQDGFGGLDVFVSKLGSDLQYGQPQNLGTPVNSKMDDFGFIFNEKDKTGYFSSNRPGGVGLDDIYTFVELLPLPCETVIKGSVFVQNASKNSSAVTVNLLDANGIQIATTQADADGKYHFEVNCLENGTIQAGAQGLVFKQIEIETRNQDTVNINTIVLKKEQPHFKIGDDLAIMLKIRPIYFDLDKSNIRPDAELELIKVKEVLQKYPSLSIEIRAHTDSRDSDKNNQILSNERAVSTLKWLVENQIDQSRLNGIGLGESQLLNLCSDGMPCTEEQHQQNRRCEFIVTKM
ncbi:OmpA family protein [Flavobacterium tegetincola]|uniref:OmpA family protein n=1 Tax=Flavobacterium tegetincola TaxID=150172 RepID=UPI0004063D3B|nr:OmpA family protein [Flavobacterium tegetincola]